MAINTVETRLGNLVRRSGDYPIGGHAVTPTHMVGRPRFALQINGTMVAIAVDGFRLIRIHHSSQTRRQCEHLAAWLCDVLNASGPLGRVLLAAQTLNDVARGAVAESPEHAVQESAAAWVHLAKALDEIERGSSCGRE